MATSPTGEYRDVPQDIAAEKAVLGAIFFDVHSDNALVTAQAILSPTDFYRQAHQRIFEAMIGLAAEERPIDILTLQDKLNQMQQLENIGGIAYLADISEASASAANLKHYAQIVREKAILRRLITTLTATMTSAYDATEPSTLLLDTLNQQIEQLAESELDSDFKPIKRVLEDFHRNLEAAANNDSDVTGLATGYPDLDKYTHGFKEDELIIIAARPAVGKTAFVLNLAKNVAKNAHVPVVIFSLEMGAVSLVNRLVAAEGNIDSNHLTTGQMDESDWQSLTLAMDSLAKMAIYMDDTPGIKITQMTAKLRSLEKDLLNRMSAEQRQANPHPLGLVVIDYLQLIESNNHENRQQEVSAISRSLKKLAKELHTPILALSQLSRGVESRQDKRPVLSDIRESGSIEQDADIVAFLYRDDYYRDGGDGDEEIPGEAQETGPIEVIIEKNRSGARGTATLMFNKPTFKFSPMAPTYRNDVGGQPDLSTWQ